MVFFLLVFFEIGHKLINSELEMLQNCDNVCTDRIMRPF